MTEPLSDSDLKSIRRRTGEGGHEGETINVEAEEVVALLDEVARARALLDQAAAMFAPGIEEDGKLWRLAEARGDLAKRIAGGDFWERLPEAEAWLAAARGGSGETWHDRARTLLRRVEWSAVARHPVTLAYVDTCPDCHALKDDGMHTSKCEIAALMGGK